MGRKVALRHALTSDPAPLRAAPDWTSIYFFRGAELADPNCVLEGSRKGMRHIKLRRPKDAKRPALKKLIRQAFKVGGADMRGR